MKAQIMKIPLLSGGLLLTATIAVSYVVSHDVTAQAPGVRLKVQPRRPHACPMAGPISMGRGSRKAAVAAGGREAAGWFGLCDELCGSASSCSRGGGTWRRRRAAAPGRGGAAWSRRRATAKLPQVQARVPGEGQRARTTIR